MEIIMGEKALFGDLPTGSVVAYRDENKDIFFLIKSTMGPGVDLFTGLTPTIAVDSEVIILDKAEFYPFGV